MIFVCDLCGKDIIESTFFYSLNLNYERFHGAGIEVGTSNCLLTMCDKCVGKLPLGKMLTYGVRVGGVSGHERYEQIMEIFNGEDEEATSDSNDK